MFRETSRSIRSIMRSSFGTRRLSAAGRILRVRDVQSNPSATSAVDESDKDDRVLGTCDGARDHLRRVRDPHRHRTGCADPDRPVRVRRSATEPRRGGAPRDVGPAFLRGGNGAVPHLGGDHGGQPREDVPRICDRRIARAIRGPARGAVAGGGKPRPNPPGPRKPPWRARRPPLPCRTPNSLWYPPTEMSANPFPPHLRLPPHAPTPS